MKDKYLKRLSKINIYSVRSMSPETYIKVEIVLRLMLKEFEHAKKKKVPSLLCLQIVFHRPRIIAATIGELYVYSNTHTANRILELNTV